MAYTICDRNGDCRPLRLIVPNVHGVPEVKAEFTPFWWVCDPCNSSEKRYSVEYNSAQETPTYLSWYQVVTTDDSAEDVAVKVAYYARVIAARNALDAASVEYRRLTGCGETGA
jgi:hypothetical protein